jgi:FkbM family methyltransferase
MNGIYQFRLDGRMTEEKYPYKIIQTMYGKLVAPDTKGWSNKPTGLVDRYEKRGIYEPSTVNYIKDNIENRSMVHCGAAFGDMLPAFSQFTSKTVYAYEPNPIAAWCAKKTIEINNLKNINFTQIGLGDREAEVDFIYQYENGDHLAGGSRFVDSKIPDSWNFDVIFKNAKTKKILIKKLDDILNEEVGIIHLDVEGYETKILEGAINIITSYSPILILEKVDENENVIKEKIIPLGYKLTKILDENSIWVKK